jgi:hypothetical protein
MFYCITTATGKNPFAVQLNSNRYTLFHKELRGLSASKPYRSNDHRLSAKLVSTFADKGVSLS